MRRPRAHAPASSTVTSRLLPFAARVSAAGGSTAAGRHVEAKCVLSGDREKSIVCASSAGEEVLLREACARTAGARARTDRCTSSGCPSFGGSGAFSRSTRTPAGVVVSRMSARSTSPNYGAVSAFCFFFLGREGCDLRRYRPTRALPIRGISLGQPMMPKLRESRHSLGPREKVAIPPRRAIPPFPRTHVYPPPGRHLGLPGAYSRRRAAPPPPSSSSSLPAQGRPAQAT